MILKNGTEEQDGLVAVTMLSVGELMDKNPIAFYELVMIARDSKHRPFGNTGSILERLSLINSGQMHDSIRNIVLNAVSGEGMEMVLGSPAR